MITVQTPESTTSTMRRPLVRPNSRQASSDLAFASDLDIKVDRVARFNHQQRLEVCIPPMMNSGRVD